MAVVSERLRTFLQQRLASLEQIEVVLLLRSDPSRAWTAPAACALAGSGACAEALVAVLLAGGAWAQLHSASTAE